jgi:hypothetical protein
MANTYVNLTAPAGGYESQLADIVRRQKYAELLAQQGASEIDAGSVGGVPTPISPFQGLAKVFQQGMGGYLAGQATKDQEALDTVQSKKYADALSQMYDPRPDLTNYDVAITGKLDPTTGNRGANVGMVDTSGLNFTRQPTSSEQAQAARGLIGTKYADQVPGMLSQARESERYATAQTRLDAAEAFDVQKRKEDVDYRTERAKQADKIALEEAAARREAHRDSVALRNVTAAGPSKAFTVTGADGKTTNFFGTNAEARALSLQGKRVVEGGIAPKAVPTRAADDLMTKASAYDKAKGLSNDFKPEYTNLGVVGFGGDAVLALKKKYGDNDPAVQWWTAYNEKAGQIRNKLYGASLTPNEIAEWLKIAVNPNMNGTTIQANLERQRQLEENAMFRSIGSLKGSGYSEESISGATAYPSSEFKFNKPQAVLPDKPVDNSEDAKRARLAAARAALAAANAAAKPPGAR